MTLHQARTALESLLTTEYQNRGAAAVERHKQAMDQLGDEELVEEIYGPVDLYLNKASPAIISRGSHQLILGLGNGWIAKTLIPEHETSGHYILRASSVYSPEFRSTNEHLIGMGMETLGIMLPEHQYVSMQRTGETISIGEEPNPGFVITPDLTEGGRYELMELNDQNLSTVTNRNTLKDASDQAIKLMSDASEGLHPQYKAKTIGHGGEAFAHMLFIRRDPTTGLGALVAGDQDHIIFSRKTDERTYCGSLERLGTAVNQYDHSAVRD